MDSVCASDVRRRQMRALRETNEGFTSWSYFRLFIPWGIPIQLRMVPFLKSISVKLCDTILY